VKMTDEPSMREPIHFTHRMEHPGNWTMALSTSEKCGHETVAGADAQSSDQPDPKKVCFLHVSQPPGVRLQ
jgi:hypothetical protein